MTAISAIALSGMQAAQTRMQSGAHNIANWQTGGFRREVVSASARDSGGVDVAVGRASDAGHDMTTDVVGLIEARHAYLANLAVFKSGDRVLGTLIDTLGG